MRKNDITVGEDYGYKPYGESDTPRRVKVLELNAARTAYSGSRDYRGHTVHDGVLVQKYDYQNETLATRKVTVEENIEVAPEVYVEEFGYTIPARYETRKTVTTVPDTDVVQTRKLTQPWADEVKDTEAARKRKESTEAQKAQFEADVKTANAQVANLLARPASSIAVRGAYTSDRKYYQVGIVIPLDELKALIALADEAISQRNLEDARG